MFYTILTVGLYLLFYALPIFLFLGHKLKWSSTFLLFVTAYFINRYTGLSDTDFILLFASSLMLMSLYDKALPYEIDYAKYSFKIGTFIHIIPFVIVGKLAGGLCGGLASILLTKYGIDHQVVQQTVSELSETNNLWVTIMGFLTLCLIAPVTEEYTIRYVLNGTLLQKKCHVNAVLSSIISSLIFALLHDSIPGIVNAFVAGLVFSRIYNRYGIWYSIAAHALFNFSAFLVIQFG